MAQKLPMDPPETDLFSFFFNRKDRPFPANKVIYQAAESPQNFYTYTQVQNTAISFGTALITRLHFTPGSVLAVVSPNNIDIPPVVLGTHYAGGAATLTNPSATATELTHQLRDSSARIILTHLSCLPTVRTAASTLQIPNNHIFLLGDARDPTKKTKHFTSILPWSDVSLPACQHLISSPRTTTALLPYSSGTTGTPKGVILTHYNMTSNVLQCTDMLAAYFTWHGGPDYTLTGISAALAYVHDERTGKQYGGDKILSALPCFHIYGLMVSLLMPLYLGTTAVIVSSRFHPLTFSNMIKEHKVTVAYLVPPMALALTKMGPKVKSLKLDSLRMTICAAAPLGAGLIEKVWEVCGIRSVQAYGLSETSPGVAQQGFDDWWEGRGSVGKFLPGVEYRLVRDGDGEEGELWLKGPNVFHGYLNRVQATRECLDEDGWFRTGDVGLVDKQGRLFITDRIKELIKYKGFQVAPAELESILLQCPIVEDVAVLGVWDEHEQTEVPMACCVRKGGINEVSPRCKKKVQKFLDGRVSGYKQLRGGVRWVEEVPKSASGKILRRVLKEMMGEGKSGNKQVKL